MRKRSILRRILRLYLLFFLCLSLFILALTVVFTKEVHADQLSLLGNTLKNGVSSFDDTIRSLTQAAKAFYARLDLREFEKSRQPFNNAHTYTAMTLLRDFRNLGYACVDVEEMGLILPNDAVITKTQLHTSGENFFRLYLANTDASDFESWKASLLADEMTFGFKLTQFATEVIPKHDTLLFALRFTERSDGAVFFAVFSLDTLNNTFLPGITHEGIKNGIELSVMAEENSVATKNDKETVWAFSAYGPSFQLSISQIYIRSQLKNVYAFCAFLGIVYLLVGVGLVFVFSVGASKPVKDIAKMTTDAEAVLFLDSAPKMIGNEYDYIHDFITRMSQKFNEYDSVIASQNEILQENYIESLLHTAPTQVTQLSVELPNPWRMAVIELQDTMALSQGEYSTLTRIVRAALLPSLPGSTRLHFINRMCVVISPSTDDLSVVCKRFTDAPIATLCRNVRIAISGVYEGIDALSHCFARLNCALSFLPINALYPANVYMEEQYQHSECIFLSGHDRFATLLLRNRLDEALKQLDSDIERANIASSSDIITMRQLFYNYRQALSSVSTELAPTRQINLPDIGNAGNISASFEELRVCTERVFAQLCAERQPDTGRAEQILAFIQQHYCNPEIYARIVAEHFGISEATLQQDIKLLTGMTFQVCLENLRLTTAYKLLCETKLPIAKVMEDSGYGSSSAFYRAFKHRYGVAPGAVRDQ